MGTFEAQAQVEEVSVEGELRLVNAAVCAGELICGDHELRIANNRSKADELVRPMTLQMGGQVVFHLCARFSAQLAPNACVLERTGSNPIEDGDSCIIVRAPWMHKPFVHLPCRERPRIHNPLNYLRERIPVWLVRMGVGTHERNYFVTYFLVCVGDNLRSPLHKIGYVGLASDFVKASQFAGLLETTAMCRIGGLGSHSATRLIFKRGGSCLWRCEYCFGCFSWGNYNSCRRL